MSTLIRRDAWGRPYAVRTRPARSGPGTSGFGRYPDPFHAFDARFDALVRTAFGERRAELRPAGFIPAAAFVPAAEVVREGDDAVLRLEVPGVDVEKDVTVEVTGRRLTVRGERRDERSSEDGEEQAGRLHEVRYGSFTRSFTLPEHVDADGVTATAEAGVLSVRVTGAYTSTEPRRIAVSTGTGELPVAASEQAEQGQTEQAA